MNPQSSPPERGKAWRARNPHSAGIDRCHLLDRVELDPTLGSHELRRRLRDHNRNEVRRAVSSCPFSAPIRKPFNHKNEKRRAANSALLYLKNAIRYIFTIAF